MIRIMELIATTYKSEMLEYCKTGYFVTHFEVLLYDKCVFALKCIEKIIVTKLAITSLIKHLRKQFLQKFGSFI